VAAARVHDALGDPIAMEWLGAAWYPIKDPLGLARSCVLLHLSSPCFNAALTDRLIRGEIRIIFSVKFLVPLRLAERFSRRSRELSHPRPPQPVRRRLRFDWLDEFFEHAPV